MSAAAFRTWPSDSYISIGEICIDIPSRMLRYQRSAHETRRVLRRRLLCTGDLGYLHDGELFWVE